MKTKILIILLLIFLSSIVDATVAKTTTGRMVLRDIFPGEPAEAYIGLINDNEFSLVVSFVVDGDLIESVKFSEEKITLNPGERKDVPFTIVSDTAGTFTTKITSVFTPEEENTVGITTTVTTIVKAEEPAKTSILPTLTLILILALIVLFLYKRVNKKPKKRLTKKSA